MIVTMPKISKKVIGFFPGIDCDGHFSDGGHCRKYCWRKTGRAVHLLQSDWCSWDDGPFLDCHDGD